MSSGSLQLEDKLQTIVRVLTFNILSADNAAWERRREVARTGLQAIRPDIVALQETTPGQGSDQALDLLGPGYHVIEHPTHSEDQVGSGARKQVAVQRRTRNRSGSRAARALRAGRCWRAGTA